MRASARGLILFHSIMYASSSSAHSLLITGRLRNINLISIDYALRPHLRTRLTPGRRTWPWETLGLRRTGFSPVLSLLMSASSLVCAPRSLTVTLRRTDDALLPLRYPEGYLQSAASVLDLIANHFRRKIAR